ncbi:hypothetical protein KY284_023457 [Solanum tuberosum]|nr:hypothetical protein KY284_023457 [Solanum tuberosum]
MPKTRDSDMSGRREAGPEVVVETLARGRGRAQARECTRGVALAKVRVRGTTVARGRAREVSLEPQWCGRYTTWFSNWVRCVYSWAATNYGDIGSTGSATSGSSTNCGCSDCSSDYFGDS